LRYEQVGLDQNSALATRECCCYLKCRNLFLNLQR